MSKKDFELIAATIASFKGFDPLQNYKLRQALAEHFANNLARTNPAFNNPRFIAACFKES